MLTVSADDPKVDLGAIVDRLAGGEDVLISRGGVPVARLVALPAITGKRTPGSARGEFVVPDDFNAPLPDEVLESFER